MPRKGAYKFISNNLSCSDPQQFQRYSASIASWRCKPGNEFCGSAARGGRQVANGDHRHRRGRYQNWVNEVTITITRARCRGDRKLLLGGDHSVRLKWIEDWKSFLFFRVFTTQTWKCSPINSSISSCFPPKFTSTTALQKISLYFFKFYYSFSYFPTSGGGAFVLDSLPLMR